MRTLGMESGTVTPANARLLSIMSSAAVETGVGALYKGFFPTWSRLGPWQLTFWLCYEQLRLATGMGAF